jgi:hypothetical protein
MTISAGTIAGHKRRVSRGRSHRKTRATATNITIPVRETVAATAAASANTHIHHRR